MASSRSRRVLLVIVLLLIALLLLLLGKCGRKPVEPAQPPRTAVEPSPAPGAEPREAVPAGPAVAREPERLTSATLEAPASVVAGTVVSVRWTGPANPEDYITIVAPDAEAARYENYALTSVGNPLDVTAPVVAGAYELRYVTGRTKTVLGKAPLQVTAADATVRGAAQAYIGALVPVEWTGPNNPGDYVTIVPQAYADGRSAGYAYTKQGARLEVTAPIEPGPAEIRYMTGQGNRVLARASLTLTVPAIVLDAPASVTEGNSVRVTWSGPANRGDYITIVEKTLPDGQYGNNDTVRHDAPGGTGTVNVNAPMQAGAAEIRYMTGQGARVLARRALSIEPARVTLAAPAEAAAGSSISITWTGPNNRGDYITIVAKADPDAKVGRYVDVGQKTTASLPVPNEPGVAELRYVSGQGRKVLGRRTVEVK